MFWLPGVHGVLVDVILADVDVSLPLEVPHHHLLHVAQVPHGVAVSVLRTRFKRLSWQKGNMWLKILKEETGTAARTLSSEAPPPPLLAPPEDLGLAGAS